MKGVVLMPLPIFPNEQTTAQPPLAGVKTILAIAAGKGGVGKSSVTVNLGLALKALGYQVGIMDTDIYGPSIRQMLPEEHLPTQKGNLIEPALCFGIKMISMAYFRKENEAVAVRAPIANSLIAHFIKNVNWGALDILLIDFPPGTGDIQLTLSQQANLTGAIMVTTPQEVAMLDVRKAMSLFEQVKIPILGVVDVFAGYGYDCSTCFVIRPFFGLRSARIDQKIHTKSRFEQSIDSSLFSSSISSYQSDFFVTTVNRNKQKFVGVGPLIGLEADWAFGCGFSLYVSAAVTWLYGQFDVHQHQGAEFFDRAHTCKFKSDLDTVLAGADAAIGVRWMTDFYCDTRLIVQVALEHHSYYDFNRIGRYGDLSFDGVSISAGLGF
jgi:Mrp family chromosome partitioning ATPase